MQQNGEVVVRVGELKNRKNLRNKSSLGHSRLMTMKMAAMQLYQNFLKFRYIEK